MRTAILIAALALAGCAYKAEDDVELKLFQNITENLVEQGEILRAQQAQIEFLSERVRELQTAELRRHLDDNSMRDLRIDPRLFNTDPQIQGDLQ